MTEELSPGKRAGGIGSAFHELALALRQAGHAVDVVYVPEDSASKPSEALAAYYIDRGIRVIDPNVDQYVWSPTPYENRSYAVLHHLLETEEQYDFIHFHDFKGLGFFTLVAKGQCLGFMNTKIVVQVHGPTRWTLEANDHPFSHEDQLKIDFMERECIARADWLVCPSKYMVTWLTVNGWAMPPPEWIRIIPNIFTHLSTMLTERYSKPKLAPCNEIVFFGRHEERKGIEVFCDALDLVADDLHSAGVRTTFLGGFGFISGEASALYLARRSCSWKFPIRLLPDFDRIAASRYLAGNDRSVAVIPSRFENCPYTVIEAAIAGKPLIISARGGGPELLDPVQTETLTCEMDRDALAGKLLEAVHQGLPAARLASEVRLSEKQWIAFHNERIRPAPKRSPGKSRSLGYPKVVAAITHYNRPAKLYDAVLSLTEQLYPNLEIVVVDDGTRDTISVELLARLAPMLSRLNVRILHQNNRDLGAARNLAISQTDSDYILFLDDDDIAFPNLVQMLVIAAESSGADIMNCIQLYMAEYRRPEAHPFPDRFQEKVSYVPLGGPVSIAPLENCYGGSTVLIRRSGIKRIGGYTEDYGVGHEDYDLYSRALQAGLRIEICPLPLVLYEVGRPSMLTTTSRLRNWNRVARGIDASKNPAAWADLVSLTAGRRALEHVRNYNEWWIANHPQSDLLQRITCEKADNLNYAVLMKDYAITLGARAYAEALSELVAARSLDSQERSAVLMPPMTAMASITVCHKPELDSLILGGLIDMQSDRLDQAVAAFMLSRERNPGSLSAVQLRILRELARHNKLPPAGAAKILELLLHRSFDLEELQILIPVMFRLALRAEDLRAAIDIVDRALIMEEKTYLAAHPSVSQDMPAGTYQLALDNMRKGGDHRGDSSFSLLRELGYALQANFGVAVPMSSLRSYLLALYQGERAVEVSRSDLPDKLRRNGNGNGLDGSARQTATRL